MSEVTSYNLAEAIPQDGSIQALGSAVRSLLVVPAHDSLCRDLKASGGVDTLPLQPSIEGVASEASQVVQGHTTPRAEHALTGSQLTYLGGVLIQFTDHAPGLRRPLIPYAHAKGLHEAVIDTAGATTEPLSFSRQLAVAMDQTSNDLGVALWRLFVTSRQYARYHDNSIVDGAPLLAREEKLKQMLDWQNALAACKPAELGYQDAAGDAYYAWTHAMAEYAYRALPAAPNVATVAARRIFRVGTNIMQPVTNTFYRRGILSDHSVAAAYGKAIGVACVSG
jgi:hypothetical protein